MIKNPRLQRKPTKASRKALQLTVTQRNSGWTRDYIPERSTDARKPPDEALAEGRVKRAIEAKLEELELKRSLAL